MEILSQIKFNGTAGTVDQALLSNGGSLLPAWETVPAPIPYAEVPTGAVNGVNTVFTLSSTPASSAGVIMLVDQGTYFNGIDYTVSGTTVTFAWAPAANSVVFAYYNTLAGSGGGGGDVTLGGVQTLTNKTLTSPQINTPKLNTSSTIGYVWTANDTTGGGDWAVAAGGGGDVTLNGTQTLTNKTLTTPQINSPNLNTTSTVGHVWAATNVTGAGAWTALPEAGDVTLTGTQTLTNKTLTSPVINTPTGIVKGDVGLGDVDNTSDATKNSAVATLTNKRINPRVVTDTSTNTLTVDSDTTDLSILTAQGQALTIAAPTGTPVEGQKLMIRIMDNGTARAFTFDPIFRGIGLILPTGTSSTKVVYIGAIYNSTALKWDVIAVAQET